MVEPLRGFSRAPWLASLMQLSHSRYLDAAADFSSVTRATLCKGQEGWATWELRALFLRLQLGLFLLVSTLVWTFAQR